MEANRTKMDHIVIGARDLAQGVDFVNRVLGVDMPFGGVHQLDKAPVLLTWVVNTDNIIGMLEALPFSFGMPEKVTRGNLTWCFGLPEDGRLLAGGMLPYVMEWQTEVHPAANMADLGCRLQQVEIYHPHPAWLEEKLDLIGAASLVRLQALPEQSRPYLMVHMDTPDGPRTLKSCGYREKTPA